MTTYYSVPILRRNYETFQLREDRKSRCIIFTESYFILFQLTRPNMKFLQLPHDHISHFSNCHTTSNHIFPIATLPNIKFYQLSHVHIIYYFSSPRPQFTFFQMSHDHISQYTNIHTNIVHVFPIVTQTQVILNQLSHEHVTYFFYCHTTTFYIVPYFTQRHVTFYKLTQKITYFNTSNVA